MKYVYDKFYQIKFFVSRVIAKKHVPQIENLRWGERRSGRERERGGGEGIRIELEQLHTLCPARSRTILHAKII